MADISKITLPSGTTYDIKDATARQAIAGGVTFLGVSTTAITNGGTQQPTIDGVVTTPLNGSMVIYGDAEFIYSGTYGSGGTWAEFGDLSTLGDLAYKDTASGTVTVPATFSTTVTPSTTTKYVASSATGGGSVTAGTAASCTLPSLSATVSGETLTLGWTAGSFTANTPTAVTLPSFSSQTIVKGISSASTSTATTESKTVTVS